jgi:hypothetical protein
LVEVIRRYSRQTYRCRTLRALEQLLGVEPVPRLEDPQIGRIHRLDVRLGAAVLVQLVTDYEYGASTAELQQRFGLSKGSILSILHASGARVRRQPLGDDDMTRIVELYESGLSIRQVAAQLAIPKTTVQNTLARTSVVMRPAVRQRRKQATLADRRRHVQTALVLRLSQAARRPKSQAQVEAAGK